MRSARPGHEAWLERGREPALDPVLPICDPHHHLWRDPEKFLLDEYGLEEYLCEDFAADALGAHRIVSSVFVACGTCYRKDGPPPLRPVGETDFIDAIARRYQAEHPSGPSIAAGIVGFADLAQGAAVASVLEAHLKASPERFRGIRHSVTWDASPLIRHRGTEPRAGWLLDPVFRQGFACLERYGLTFDAWLFHPQLPELADLAAAFPATPIILNHAGGPLGVGPYEGRRDEVFEIWRGGIARVAACPNVVVKFGGLGLPRAGFDWGRRATPASSQELANAFAPYFDVCIEHFGPNRCMFESNFPADRVSYPCGTVWNSFKRLARQLSACDQHALFHDTAARIYRIEDAVTRGQTS